MWLNLCPSIKPTYLPTYLPTQVPQVDWLDRVSLPYTSRIMTELSTHHHHHSSSSFQSLEEQALSEHGYLVINLPMFQHPVLYEEKPYPGVGLPIGFQVVTEKGR